MKHAINWKLFAVLLAAGVAAGTMVMPYLFALSPSLARHFTPVVIVAQTIQFLLLFSVAIFLGLYLGKRVGLGAPILENLVNGATKSEALKPILGLSIGGGVLAGWLIILLSFFFPGVTLTLLKTEAAIALWKTFFASFYGGIAEELLMRLFLVTFLVWLSWTIRKTSDGRPTTLGV